MIAILDYKGGNITSVVNAIERLGYTTLVTSDVKTLKQAEKVIIPGVGDAKMAMEDLCNKGLDVVIQNLKQPVLGICLGMQLLCKSSEEGNVKGLGIFDTEVKLFPKGDIVPQMGWNSLTDSKGILLEGLPKNGDYYFVHSYFAELCDATTGVCNYIQPFSAVLEKNNFYGTQFHPEKSGEIGAQLLKNFLAL